MDFMDLWGKDSWIRARCLGRGDDVLSGDRLYDRGA